MENNEEIKKEDKLDIKAVFSKLVDEEPEILSQEEAIKIFREEVKKRKNIEGTKAYSALEIFWRTSSGSIRESQRIQ